MPSIISLAREILVNKFYLHFRMNQILNSRNSQFYVLIYQYPQLDMEINLELEHSLVEHVQFPVFICLGNNEKVY